MIVSFILKVHQPFLSLTVYLHGHYNRAGVDFLGFLLILQLSFRFQLPHGHKRQIHQAYKLVLPPFKNLRPIRKILLICLLQRLSVIALPKAYILKLGRKSGMAAMIGPVGIQHPNLGHRRIALLLVPEIFLYMKEIFEGHCKIKRCIKALKGFLLHPAEALQNLYIRRLFKLCHQGFGLYHACLSGVYRIDAKAPDGCKLFVRDRTRYHISDCRPYHRLLVLF